MNALVVAAAVLFAVAGPLVDSSARGGATCGTPYLGYNDVNPDSILVGTCVINFIGLVPSGGGWYGVFAPSGSLALPHGIAAP